MSSGLERQELVERFGAYDLIRRLGRGGMAETFEAIRRSESGVEQRVCLKRILPVFDGDSDFQQLFLREAKISATLRHSNVAQVLDFGDFDGRHYLVLELVDGVDLRTLLRGLLDTGETLDPNVLGYLAVELARALEYAHEATVDGAIRGIIHRDISPTNVLISSSGDVKLTDFGVAKAINSPSLTRTGGAKGKIPYMAPEYARSGVCDARSDLFSLGVMLYECAAGRRPFDGANDIETLERVSKGSHVSLMDLAQNDTSPALVEAIEALICCDPEGRPANAGVLLERLAAAPVRPSARLSLGRMAAERRATLATEAQPLGLLDTARATPDGTLVVGAAAPSPWVIDSAPADAVTRTQAPRMDADAPPTRGSLDVGRSAPEETPAGERTANAAKAQDASSPTTVTTAGLIEPLEAGGSVSGAARRPHIEPRLMVLGLLSLLALGTLIWFVLQRTS